MWSSGRTTTRSARQRACGHRANFGACGLDGSIRIDSLQRDEQTPEMLALYEVSQAAHGAMTRAVEVAVVRPKRAAGKR